MRILHLDLGREMRGGQWQVLQLMKAQAEAGDQPALLARDGSPLLVAAKEAGIEADALHLAAVWRGSRAARITHCHDGRSHSFAALAARRPFVVSRRVAFPVRRGVLSHWKYACAAHYLAVSRYVAAELNTAGVPQERVSVVPDAVVLPERMSDRSGPVVALESSDPGKGMTLLQKAADLMGLPVLWSRDLARDFVTARLFVYISDSEGLGSAALLAMAFGIPVVASRVGGLPEIVRHEETGLLTENDPQSIAEGINRLERDPNLCARIIATARTQVEGHHVFPRLAASAGAVYRKVLA
jgi:hypothetical protein